MLTFFSHNDIENLTNTRKGEIKLGENVTTLNPKKQLFVELENSDALFVILGVPEDIGVRMNYGLGGAHTAFIPALKALLNIQENQFITGNDILVLGYLDCLNEVVNFDPTNRKKGDTIVNKIDDKLSEIIQIIIESNKIPIIIGGGHNNAFGNLKGLSLAKKQPINAINLDAHTDLRLLEKRHSGNGFSYALKEGFLQNYFIFGLHENYTPQYIFDLIHNNINIEYNTFEELAIYKTTRFESELTRAKNFIKNAPFGIEIDLDCIQNFPSSAITPSGFTPEQTREFVYTFGKLNLASYLHICEGAPAISNHSIATNLVGKFISYLISDFIKAKKYSY
ncbi:formimidoylglutamase [Tenacibaculum sp. UWU-22]|uniref:formimidoylglutamase n=1 Tax=Tenacibaculum sp. UWU-22 TaxID=3234187 RepID=UPI0034DB45E7